MFKKSILSLAVLLCSSVSAQTLTTGPKLKAQSISDSMRIVGGEEVTAHSLPYQASVQSLGGSHFCGGSIIGKALILTAAHCMEGVNGESPEMQVRVGAHSLTDGSGQSIKVEKAYTNQEYPNLSKDVAVLKLSQEITDSNAKIIKLADQSFFDANISAGVSFNVSGWGTLSSGGQMPDKLMAVEVPYVTNEVCNSANAYNGQIQDTEICAGYKQGGKDSCQGDSGGPLVFTHNNEFYQVGVVSWGEGCALADKYGVYGNVAALNTWINSAMAGNEPASGLAGGGDGEGGGEGEAPEGNYLAFQETISYTTDQEALAFVLDVPEGTNVIYISTKGGEGDVDLTAERNSGEDNGDSGSESSWFDDEYGFFDMPMNYYNSANMGNDEMIVIQAPESGEWVITFSDFSDYSNVELTVFAH